MTVAKLIDTSLCIGCKACEIACQEWNDQEFNDSKTSSEFHGTYQTMPKLAHNFWNLIQFNEIEREGKIVAWNFSKYQCMHCADAGCMRACPAPGAIVRLANGTVDFVHDNCIGCGYCITGCPFEVPKLSPKTNKVYKCTLCSDRTAVGLEPACIKACPTSCLTFGERGALLHQAQARTKELQKEGHKSAGVYNPAGVGGTNVLYVLKDASRPEDYSLPRDPAIPLSVQLWKGPVKWLGSLVFAGGVLGAFLHYLRVGPKKEEADHE